MKQVISVHECDAYKWINNNVGLGLVPRLLHNRYSRKYSYLVISKLYGKIASDRSFRSNRVKLVKAITNILNTLWSVDISKCDLDASLEFELRQAEYNVSNHLVDIDNVCDSTFDKNGKQGKFRSPEHLLKWLKENKPDEDLVFTHGDFTLTNIFLNDNYNLNGLIDLGQCGKADRYRDISICLRELRWELGDSWNSDLEDLFFRELKINKDNKKLEYYLLLDELF